MRTACLVALTAFVAGCEGFYCPDLDYAQEAFPDQTVVVDAAPAPAPDTLTVAFVPDPGAETDLVADTARVVPSGSPALRLTLDVDLGRPASSVPPPAFETVTRGDTVFVRLVSESALLRLVCSPGQARTSLRVTRIERPGGVRHVRVVRLDPFVSPPAHPFPVSTGRAARRPAPLAA